MQRAYSTVTDTLPRTTARAVMSHSSYKIESDIKGTLTFLGNMFICCLTHSQMRRSIHISSVCVSGTESAHHASFPKMSESAFNLPHAEMHLLEERLF